MKKTFWASLIASATLLHASPATATVSLYCDGIDEPNVSVLMTLGSLPVLAVINARIVTPQGTYAMDPSGEDVPILFGQGVASATGVSADFTDPNIEDILISLRTMQRYTEDSSTHIGLLTIENTQVFAVRCES